MSDPIDFLALASVTYTDANAATLRWMLDRTGPSGFLDTKQSSISLANYGPADGLRGPDYLYGWIQGRGLEAIATHAAYFEGKDEGLAHALDNAGAGLYALLDQLSRPHGHAYFCYDADRTPVYPSTDGAVRKQLNPADIFTYSDAFVAKGLVAAAARYAPADLTRQLAYFSAVIASIEDGRFQMDERIPLSRHALDAQADDFGPRMILLGAAGMLSRLGLTEHAAYADRFIAHVIENHLDPRTGLLRNVPGEDACNVGHGIEFVGFALDYLPAGADAALVQTLERILIASFRYGYVEPGIALSVSLETGTALSPYCPWWSLPETIRSAALCYQRTGNPEALTVWRQAHEAFFTRYWRGTPPIAYQTMTKDGPVDFVPATPDLDPGYHTGLSLLAAIHVADALRVASPVPTQA
jgi:mannose/cellobiose epimerase-like protein (N-acyl-D-glucosamine 2-epimerase family)